MNSHSEQDEEEEDLDYTPNTKNTTTRDESEASSSEEESQISESEAEFTDDDDEEGENGNKSSKKKPAKKRASNKKVKSAVKEKRSRFLDTEAQVGDESDEDDEAGEDEFLQDFIAGSDEEEEAAAAAAELRTRPRIQQIADSNDDFDAEAEEERLKSLYGRSRDTSSLRKTDHSTSSTAVPRPFLLPSVTDPKLWLCKAQQGRERSSALALLRVVMERQYSGQPLQIFSIIARDGLKGYVYIEAHKPTQIAQAIEIAKLNHCLYPGQAGKSLLLVPLAEMPQVLQTTAASGSATAASTTEIPDIGAWVRVKRGRYANDLAQVVDNAQDEGSYDPSNLNTCIIRLKLLPRLDFNSSSSSSRQGRIPPRLFDPEEASRHGPVSKSRGFWIFGAETYRDGFLFKNIRLSSLQVGDSVNPTIEELARFPESERSSFSESSVGTSTGNSNSLAAAPLAPGDHVIVLEGEMRNLHATVDSLEWRPSPSTGKPEQGVHLIADPTSGLFGEAARFFLKASQVRKIFAVGAQVRILSGPHATETGIVVAIEPNTNNLIVFASGSNQQVSVPASICALAAAHANEEAIAVSLKRTNTSTTNRSSDYALDDLVQFHVDLSVGGEEGVGVVVRILDAENSVAIFDSLGQVRTLPCRSVQLLANYVDNSTKNQFSGPAASGELSQGDRVIEQVSGNLFKLLHLYKSLAFVKPISAASSGSAAISVLPAEGISKPRQVPLFRAQQGSGPGAVASGPVGHLIGKSITITGGPRKGYVGFVKQISDGIARVELHTNGKIVNVTVDKLALVNPGKGGGDSRNSFEKIDDTASSTRTPAWNSTSTSSRTPAWNSSSSSSRTPAWNSSSARTPGWNPVASSSSSRTPAWNPSASRTPAWNPSSSSTTPASASASGSGSRTPAWSTGTGLTPAWNVPTAIGTSNTAANWQKGTTPAWSSQNNSTKSTDVPPQSHQPWDQVNTWKKDKE